MIDTNKLRRENAAYSARSVVCELCDALDAERAKVARLRRVAVAFAEANPKHHYGLCEQDPCGVHALLAETAPTVLP